MGFKDNKDAPPMERELRCLLDDLCVKWGFCIPHDDYDEIATKGQYRAIEFAQDVVNAEGIDTDTGWIKRIAERFNERFGTNQIESSTFIDRVRGISENWG